jgi:hypothetical protein
MVANASVGTGAYTTIEASNAAGDNSYTRLITLGSGFTTSGAFAQNSGALEVGTNLVNGLSLITRASAPIGFYTGGFASSNQRVIITSAGNVGIATTSPVANFQVADGSNATTTMEIGSSGQNKGSCLKLYRTDGSAIYAYVAAGATTFTLTTISCANVSNF